MRFFLHVGRVPLCYCTKGERRSIQWTCMFSHTSSGTRPLRYCSRMPISYAVCTADRAVGMLQNGTTPDAVKQQ